MNWHERFTSSKLHGGTMAGKVPFDKWLDDRGIAIGNWFDANEGELTRLHQGLEEERGVSVDFVDFAVFVFMVLPVETKEEIVKLGAKAPSAKEIMRLTKAHKGEKHE